MLAADSALVSDASFFFRSFFTACARSVPLSSQICKVSAVGLNLHRMASNANLNPPSRVYGKTLPFK